jgi:uncharacterized membrane protein YoaK (UPF0700 family)
MKPGPWRLPRAPRNCLTSWTGWFTSSKLASKAVSDRRVSRLPAAPDGLASALPGQTSRRSGQRATRPGCFEAICILSFGKVFTSFQTGNFVFLGLIAGGTRPPQGPHPATVLISLATFAVGAAVAMPILHSFDGDAELDDSQVRHLWPTQATMALGLSLAPQVAFLAVWTAYSSPTRATLALMGLIAFAMGVQMNAIRFLHVAGISTTAVTATFIDLVSGLTTRTLTAPAVRRLSGVLVAIAAGALIGTLMLSYARREAPVVPVVMNATVLVIAALTLKQGRW